MAPGVGESVLAACVLGLFGLLFGSFANVLIWRVPRGESIVSPPSHCPSCGHEVRWYDNVPVVSWLVLRGRCRDCGEPISVRYPVIEAASAALCALAGAWWGLAPTAVAAACFFYLLLVLSVIDVDTGRLPNPLVAALALIGAGGVVFSMLTGVQAVPLIRQEGLLLAPAFAAVAGSAAGAGVSGLVAAVYALVRGREGLGMGDVKLLGAMGVFLGPYVLLAYVFANLVGAIWGVVAAARSRGDGAGLKIRFGPFLAAGGVVSALLGQGVWAWYLRLVGLG